MHKIGNPHKSPTMCREQFTKIKTKYVSKKQYKKQNNNVNKGKQQDHPILNLEQYAHHPKQTIQPQIMNLIGMLYIIYMYIMYLLNIIYTYV